jgi:muramoyltetrapeptide carboxypeptidase LdcA involved in peptidoglycan recycling
MAQYFDYTLEHFKRCLLSEDPFDVQPSAAWSDDEWYKDQQHRQQYQNKGWAVIHPGRARGTIWGGNLGTLSLLSGTEYMPQIAGSILFVEDDYESQPHHFDRQLTALLQQPGFDRVSGIVIGRFQRASNMTDSLLHQIIASKQKLEHLPVIANVDFGHTTPIITIPIGGECELVAGTSSRLSIAPH